MSAVVLALPEQPPRSTGGNFKLPPVFFLVCKWSLKGEAAALWRGGSPGCVANLAVDRVLCDVAALVVAAAKVNASGAASLNCAFPSCACAASGTSCLALCWRGELAWLDAIVLMNSMVISKDEKSEC